MTVKVEGLAQLSRDLKAVGADIDDLKDVMAAIAAQGAQEAAAFAPWRTGRLAASIRGNRAARKAVVVAGRGRVKYAGPVNYGWPERNIRASGFMQAADVVMGPRSVKLLDDGVRKVIERRGLA